MKQITIIENFTHDLGLPDTWLENAKSGDWEIWNAARPFPAHLYHQGEFMRGIFYGIIDPAQDLADEFRQSAQDLDASQLTFVTQEEINTWGRTKCEEIGVDFEDFDYETIAESYLNNHS
jgi:hypothetical protein